MNLAVVTVTIGEEFEKLAQLTHPTFAAYADRIGAQFVAIKTRVFGGRPHYEKLQIQRLLETFDRVVYIDTDAIVRHDAPDIFSIVPERMLGAWNEASVWQGKWPHLLQDFCVQMQEKLPRTVDFNRRYLNTGVFVASRAHRSLFSPPVLPTGWHGEQVWLNLKIAQLGIPVMELEHRWNRCGVMDQIAPASRFDAHIIHYAATKLDDPYGYSRELLPGETMLELIRRDLQDPQWKQPREENGVSNTQAVDGRPALE